MSTCAGNLVDDNYSELLESENEGADRLEEVPDRLMYSSNKLSCDETNIRAMFIYPAYLLPGPHRLHVRIPHYPRPTR